MTEPITFTASPTVPPPVGLLGGSVHKWERGTDPFTKSTMPAELAIALPESEVVTGWHGLDWCGNVVAFMRDGNSLVVERPERFASKAAMELATELVPDIGNPMLNVKYQRLLVAQKIDGRVSKLCSIAMLYQDTPHVFDNFKGQTSQRLKELLAEWKPTE